MLSGFLLGLCLNQFFLSIFFGGDFFRGEMYRMDDLPAPYKGKEALHEKNGHKTESYAKLNNVVPLFADPFKLADDDENKLNTGGKRRKTRRGKRTRKTKKRKQKKAKQSRRRRRVR